MRFFLWLVFHKLNKMFPAAWSIRFFIIHSCCSEISLKNDISDPNNETVVSPQTKLYCQSLRRFSFCVSPSGAQVEKYQRTVWRLLQCKVVILVAVTFKLHNGEADISRLWTRTACQHFNKRSDYNVQKEGALNTHPVGHEGGGNLVKSVFKTKQMLEFDAYWAEWITLKWLDACKSTHKHNMPTFLTTFNCFLCTRVTLYWEMCLLGCNWLVPLFQWPHKLIVLHCCLKLKE